jgi:hypothetical protein
MNLIEPLIPGLHACWDAADRMYRESYPDEVIAEHTDSVAAACRRQHAWMEAQRQFDETIPGCVLKRVRGLNLIIYKDKAILRLKKVNGVGLHQNYQTDQQSDFDRQVPLLDLPPAAIRLTAGYQLDPSGTVIDRKIIARVYGRSVLWTAQINVIDDVASWVDITPRRLFGNHFVIPKRSKGA